MKKHQGISIAVAVIIAIPFISHGYMAAEATTIKTYKATRARATVWMLEKLQQPYDLKLLVEAEAEAQGIRKDLALALVEQESSWNPAAVRPEVKIKTASYGLFQILPKTAKGCPGKPTASDLLHPVKNIRCGIHLFSSYLKATGSTRKALVAYNGGTGCLSKRCSQAEAYASQVMDRL